MSDLVSTSSELGLENPCIFTKQVCHQLLWTGDRLWSNMYGYSARGRYVHGQREHVRSNQHFVEVHDHPDLVHLQHPHRQPYSLISNQPAFGRGQVLHQPNHHHGVSTGQERNRRVQSGRGSAHLRQYFGSQQPKKSTSRLQAVKTHHPYNSSKEYMETYKSLLHQEAFGLLRGGIKK